MTIKNPDKYTIYDMELHDEMRVTDNIHATRVPGGWIYTTSRQSGIGKVAINVCFVPFNNEFQSS